MEEALRRVRSRVPLGSISWLVAALVAFPVAAGLGGVVLPALGYFPALGGTGLSIDPLAALLSEPGLVHSVMLSLMAGLLTTALAVAGVILFLAAFWETRAFTIARMVLAPLLAIPHAAAAFGLAFLIAPSGILFRLGAAPLGLSHPPDVLIIGDPLGLAMMAGLVVKEIPFILLVTLAAMPQTAVAQHQKLARSFGYGGMAGFVLAVWPGIYRQIRLPVIAIVGYASSVVDVALILGPSTPAPLAVRVLQWMQDPDLENRFKASAGAMLQLGITATAIMGWILVERFARRVSRLASASGTRHARDGAARSFAAIPVLLGAFCLIVGIVLLALWSVAGYWAFPDVLPESVGLASWSRALPGAFKPLATSLVVGMVAAMGSLALVMAMLESRRRAATRSSTKTVRLQPSIVLLLYLPLIVPQICFVFGLQILVLAMDATPSLALLAGIHMIFVVPYVAIALSDPWFALDARYEQVAAGLGRSPLAGFLRVRLPMLATATLVAAAIGFAVSIGQYLPTLLIGAGIVTTITTEAVALSSGANPRVIGVYALLQALLPLFAFALAALIPWLVSTRRRGVASS